MADFKQLQLHQSRRRNAPFYGKFSVLPVVNWNKKNGTFVYFTVYFLDVWTTKLSGSFSVEEYWQTERALVSREMTNKSVKITLRVDLIYLKTIVTSISSKLLSSARPVKLLIIFRGRKQCISLRLTIFQSDYYPTRKQQRRGWGW